MPDLSERDIDVERIELMHAPDEDAKVERLITSMRSGGWGKHRPVLVEATEEHEDDGFFYAWTGMHRLTAAKVVGLTTVPCLVIPRRDLDAAFKHRFDKSGNLSYLSEALVVGEQAVAADAKRVRVPHG